MTVERFRLSGALAAALLYLIGSSQARAQDFHSFQLGFAAGVGGGGAAGRDMSESGLDISRVSLMYSVGNGWAAGVALMRTAAFLRGDRVSLPCLISLTPGVVAPCPVTYTFSGASLVVQRTFGGNEADARWHASLGLGGFRVYPEPYSTSPFREPASTIGVSLELSRVLFSVGRTRFSVGAEEYVLPNVRASTARAFMLQVGATFRP